MQLNLTLNLRWSLDVNVYLWVKVVPLSRYSTGLRALFRDDQVVMQPAMILLPSLPSLPAPPSLSSSSTSLFGLKRPFQSISFLSYHKWSYQTLRCHLCISSHRRQSLHMTIVFKGYSQFRLAESHSIRNGPKSHSFNSFTGFENN